MLPKREETPSSSDDDSDSEGDDSDDEEMDLDDISDSENQLACQYPVPPPAQVGHLPSWAALAVAAAVHMRSYSHLIDQYYSCQLRSRSAARYSPPSN